MGISPRGSVPRNHDSCVIAPTYSDLRGVVFEGNSGLVAVIPKACVRSLTYSSVPRNDPVEWQYHSRILGGHSEPVARSAGVYGMGR